MPAGRLATLACFAGGARRNGRRNGRPPTRRNALLPCGVRCERPGPICGPEAGLGPGGGSLVIGPKRAMLYLGVGVHSGLHMVILYTHDDYFT